MLRSLFFITFLTFSIQAAAYFQADLLKGKKTKNDAVQWTLSDWLTQKNKAALLDQWLALHSSSNLFEMNLRGGGQQYKLKTGVGAAAASTNQNGQSYDADFYVSIFNLHGEYEKNNESKESYGGAAGLRLLGKNSQTTSLVARYGWRRLSDLLSQEHWDNQFAEGVLQLYLINQVGLQGSYRYYFPNTSTQGTKLEGHKIAAGAFFEFLIFRLYGNYYQEPLEKTSVGVVSKEERQGIEGGLQLFF